MQSTHTKKLFFLGAALVFLPKILYAQDFRSILNSLTSFVSGLIIPLLVSAALLVFLVGLAQYIFQAGDESSVDTGKNRMIWGIVGLFFIAAIWGLVTFVGNSISIIN